MAGLQSHLLIKQLYASWLFEINKYYSSSFTTTFILSLLA